MKRGLHFVRLLFEQISI